MFILQLNLGMLTHQFDRLRKMSPLFRGFQDTFIAVSKDIAGNMFHFSH